MSWRSSVRNQPDSDRIIRSFSTVANQPRKRLPVMLIKNVPQGNAVPILPKALVTPQRKRPPMDEPSATSRICEKSLTIHLRVTNQPPVSDRDQMRGQFILSVARQLLFLN